VEPGLGRLVHRKPTACRQSLKTTQQHQHHQPVIII
jgi:hypothetical protein